MAECVECGRTMRPRNTTAAQYPGTVGRNGRRCRACTTKATSASVHTVERVTCSRCGLIEASTGKPRKYDLCRDCRSVMRRDDWEAWAA